MHLFLQEKLPFEIQSMVVSYFDFEDLLQLRLVSKNFDKLVRNEIKTKHFLSLTMEFGHQMTQKLVSDIFKRFNWASLKYLTFGNISQFCSIFGL